EVARRASEYREHLVEAVFEADVQGILRLALVERQSLRNREESARRVHIEPVARRGVVVLDARAKREIGGRQDRDRLLEIAGDRGLGEIVAVVRRIAEVNAAIGPIDGVVDV